MSLLNDLGQDFSGALQGIADGANNLDKSLQSQSFGPKDFEQNGFVVPPIPGSDGTGLPSSKIPSQRFARPKREVIRWFVPEVGLVSQYVNPQQINYAHKKLIFPQRTKGGYIVSYFGQELASLRLSGHTGSSGIEGLNVLYEIYKAEQLNFDPIALTMAADSSVTGLNDLIDSALGNLGGFGTSIANSTLGLFGLDPASQNVLPRDVPSLASLALGVEMYYGGLVHRGFFTSMSYRESSQELGLINYDIEFMVTQRRGYRTNSLPWQRSAISGPSNNGLGGVPLSFQDLEPDTILGASINNPSR